MWDSRTATSRVPDSLPALQISAIKELPPPPPPAVLLNKQGRSKCSSQPLGEDETLPRWGRGCDYAARCPFILCIWLGLHIQTALF